MHPGQFMRKPTQGGCKRYALHLVFCLVVLVLKSNSHNQLSK